MLVDPALGALAQRIEEDQPWPRPQCPKCETGHLTFATPECDLDIDSEIEHPAFEPEWIRGTFVSHGQCSNPQCKRAAYATGTYWVDDSEKTIPTTGPPYSTYYQTGYVYPPILVMRVPATAPEPIRDCVRRASSVLFADPSLAATALRAAVEAFLTAQGIPCTTASGGFRQLHDRLKEWKRTSPHHADIAVLLGAVKWIGNAGTHDATSLTIPDVLEGAELLAEAFHRHYRGTEATARAREINAMKGLRATTRRD